MATAKTTKKTAVKKAAAKKAVKKSILKAPTKALSKKFNAAMDKQGPSTLTIKTEDGKINVTKRTTKPAQALPASQTGLVTKTAEPSTARSILVSDLEKRVNKIEADTLVIIRRSTDSFLTETAGASSAYLAKKTPKAAKTLKGLQERLAVFGLKTSDYEVISNSLVETKLT